MPPSLRALYRREQLHAVRGTEVYCGYEGELEVERVLWADWSRLTAIDGPEPCCECERRPIKTKAINPDTKAVCLYAGRSSERTVEVLRRLVELEPAPRPDRRWEYRIDTGRTRFADGFGDMQEIWRFSVPVPRTPKPRVLP